MDMKTKYVEHARRFFQYPDIAKQVNQLLQGKQTIASKVDEKETLKTTST